MTWENGGVGRQQSRGHLQKPCNICNRKQGVDQRILLLLYEVIRHIFRVANGSGFLTKGFTLQLRGL